MDEHLTSQLLIALPALDDPNFVRSVALICQHDAQGAMGIVVNRASDYTLGEVMEQMRLNPRDQHLRDRAVLYGGPVHPERGFVLHDGPREWESTLAIGRDLYLTTSRDVLTAVSHHEGPDRLIVTLGYAGWEPGQLEHELAQNAWLTVPADAELLFNTPLEQRWQGAASRIGVDLFRHTDYSGHV